MYSTSSVDMIMVEFGGIYPGPGAGPGPDRIICGVERRMPEKWHFLYYIYCNKT